MGASALPLAGDNHCKENQKPNGSCEHLGSWPLPLWMIFIVATSSWLCSASYFGQHYSDIVVFLASLVLLSLCGLLSGQISHAIACYVNAESEEGVKVLMPNSMAMVMLLVALDRCHFDDASNLLYGWHVSNFIMGIILLWLKGRQHSNLSEATAKVHSIFLWGMLLLDYILILNSAKAAGDNPHIFVNDHKDLVQIFIAVGLLLLYALYLVCLPSKATLWPSHDSNDVEHGISGAQGTFDGESQEDIIEEGCIEIVSPAHHELNSSGIMKGIILIPFLLTAFYSIVVLASSSLFQCINVFRVTEYLTSEWISFVLIPFITNFAAHAPNIFKVFNNEADSDVSFVFNSSIQISYLFMPIVMFWAQVMGKPFMVLKDFGWMSPALLFIIPNMFFKSKRSFMVECFLLFLITSQAASGVIPIVDDILNFTCT